MLPTEPIGSIPRPAALIEGVQGFRAGRISQPELSALYDAAVQDTIQRLEATGSPVITDGEQAKHSFATYSIYGLENLSPDGVANFVRGRTRPKLSPTNLGTVQVQDPGRCLPGNSPAVCACAAQASGCLGLGVEP